MYNNIEGLKELVKKHPVSIPVRAVAQYLGVAEHGLRAAMDQNRCPFGFGWKLGERAAYKIPTVAFVTWLTKGAIPLDF